MREVHQGKKRTDNEKRKREVTDKAGKQGLLACTNIRTCKDSVDKAGKQGILAYSYSGIYEDSVESVPQAELKSPAEYVRMAMKAHRQLTSEEFMQATGLTAYY